ncbi:MAG: BREX-1 system adenine-specific DNA-methyltransferase PglX [Firmicutes bacterium]|nr:BREX-1 system adenine-specific DNA-methyltransferase PglX [Bacillota bacterium]
MNKTAIKKVATFARKELINQVSLRVQSFGITPESTGKIEVGSDYVIISGRHYPKKLLKPFEALKKEIEKNGFDQVVEEAAYTWFNRFVALRFMEVNDYLPSKIRVLSSQTPEKVDPDILTIYREVDFPFDEAYVQERLQKGDNEAAFRHLLIAQCNQLSRIMPFLFEKFNDYTELVLPASLLHTDSVISCLVNEIEEDDFREVEIIGWMYQYYIADKKDEIFTKLKKNIKIKKEDIPAATQLFTPEWIVKYMVENSLGQLWLERHPESLIKGKMRYYVEPAEQVPEVIAKLNSQKNPYLKLEEIKIMDPACGSGHMLVYAFDLLYEIYEEIGYPKREIPYSILEHNLHGLEIDDRAAQLASFVLFMKARSITSRVFNKPPEINVLSIKETNHLKHEKIAKKLADGDIEKYEQIYRLLKLFVDAKNYGSLLCPEKDINFDFFETRIELLLEQNTSQLFEITYDDLMLTKLILRLSKILCKKYEIVLINPPYMGVKGMNTKLYEYIKEHYHLAKLDLFAAFIIRTLAMTVANGYNASINQHSWMFLSGYEELRRKLLDTTTISSMIHLGPRAFEEIGGEMVQSTAYVLRQTAILDYKGTYYRLSHYNTTFDKELSFLNKENIYVISQFSFDDIPSFSIAYWASDKVRKIFKYYPKLGELAEPRQGLATSDNNRFLRLWHEVSCVKIGFNLTDAKSAQKSKKKWIPYNKGGEYRKWYGNQQYLIDWENDGYSVKEYAARLYKTYTRTIKNIPYYFREGITWSDVSIVNFGARYTPIGFIFDVKGSTLFVEEKLQNVILAFLGTKLVNSFLAMLNPTMSFQVGNLKALPLSPSISNNIEIHLLASENVMISKTDWDSFELSWDFQSHPMLTYKNAELLINQAYENWVGHSESQFNQLKANEEKLNHIFIKMYGLEDELTPEVPADAITISQANRERDTKSFLSYAIGCMMGRYSLDVPGLAYAGGEFDWSKYKLFRPDPDGILPITDKGYFDDDIMDRLSELLKVTFGEDTLQENLYWLAESLTIKNNETPVERLRRYFMDEFYKDHLQTYQKRPIYWLFDSGKKKGFRALVYLHRYNSETLARMRLGYLQEMQVKYANEEQLLIQRLDQPTLNRVEKTAANKRLEEVRARQRELVEYDKLLADYANRRILLDLDDGVVVNYAKLQKLLSAIK